MVLPFPTASAKLGGKISQRARVSPEGARISATAFRIGAIAGGFAATGVMAPGGFLKK